MKSVSPWNQTLAVVLIVGIQLLVSPAPAATLPAALTGQIVSAEERAPVPGAIVRVVDSGTGDLYTSTPTDDKGAFRIDALPASVYSLAVQQDEGIYAAGSNVVLAPGQHRSVQVAVYKKKAQEGPEAAENSPYKSSAWSNPLTATLIALGIAVVLGAGMNEAFGNEQKTVAPPTTSPMNP
jgi:hypothetical protein